MTMGRAPVAPALLALVLAACAAQVTPPSGTATPAPSAAPTGATPVTSGSPSAAELVLRLDAEGVPGDDVSAPEFSLYGDGTAVYEPFGQAPEPNAQLPFQQAKLSAEQMSALISFAVGEGGLANARADYPNPAAGVDAGTSIFTVRAQGFDKTVSVDGLGTDDASTPDLEIRVKFLRLSGVLKDFGQQVSAGHAADAGRYTPRAFRAVLLPVEDYSGALREWPWVDLAPGDFTARANSGVRYAVITPDQARLLSASPEGGVFFIDLRGPDGMIYVVGLRVLLPDEAQ